jgi:hypothetical protein
MNMFTQYGQTRPGMNILVPLHADDPLDLSTVPNLVYVGKYSLIADFMRIHSGFAQIQEPIGILNNFDGLCGPAVRVSDYRPRDPAFDSR